MKIRGQSVEFNQYAASEKPMRKIIRRLLAAAVALTALLLAAAGGLYQASRVVPDFYRRALTAPVTDDHEQERRFEQHALALHNQLYQTGAWEVRISQDEINAWLAGSLPEKFPQALPPGLSDPRVAIGAGAVRVAVHYQRGGVDTIVSLAGNAWLTDQTNEIAVRIDQARAGIVPVPLNRFVQEIGERAARANLPLRWTESKGAPVALVRLPFEPDEAHRLTLQRLNVVGDELVVAGHTELEPREGTEPRAPATIAQPGENETRQR
jgi:hypothetical protein